MAAAESTLGLGVQRMTSGEYHAQDALGSSSLKKILRSPAHYLEEKLRPPKPTPAMVLGSAIHTRILEPHLFDVQYIVAPDISGKGSVAKKEEFAEANRNRTILKESDYELIDSATQSLYQHTIARDLLQNGHPELSFFWIDPDTGVKCKCRPDFLHNENIIVDVKTTMDASFKSFQRDIANFGYHIQAAFYVDGLKHLTGKDHDFVIAAVEKNRPYACAFYALDAATLEAGRIAYKRALKIYAECVSKNEWPGYASEIIQPMNLPAWAWGSDE